MRVDVAKIRQLRLEHHFTLEHMAELLGYQHASSYHRAEVGVRQFKPHHIAMIALHFSVPMESLFLSEEVSDAVN